MVRLISVLLIVIGSGASAQSVSSEAEIQAMYESRLNKFQTAPTPEAMADAYVADITDDAIWMPEGSPIVRGRDNVRDWAVWFFSTWKLEIGDSVAEPMLIDGNTAIRRWSSNGTYENKATGERVPFSQKYVDILRRDETGRWRLECHVWSTNNRDFSIWTQ